MITKEEIEKLANLSRIAVNDEEKESIRKDIDGILVYVGQIKNASDSSHESWAPSVRNVMREDVVTRERAEYKDSLLKLAPKNENGYVKVKRIL
jgi:aspartyl/glutamyl-tRNA(Asn/Gln) amidotransferase C subunit